jgi:hypothetical protein
MTLRSITEWHWPRKDVLCDQLSDLCSVQATLARDGGIWCSKASMSRHGARTGEPMAEAGFMQVMYPIAIVLRGEAQVICP